MILRIWKLGNHKLEPAQSTIDQFRQLLESDLDVVWPHTDVHLTEIQNWPKDVVFRLGGGDTYLTPSQEDIDRFQDELKMARIAKENDSEYYNLVWGPRLEIIECKGDVWGG